MIEFAVSDIMLHRLRRLVTTLERGGQPSNRFHLDQIVSSVPGWRVVKVCARDSRRRTRYAVWRPNGKPDWDRGACHAELTHAQFIEKLRDDNWAADARKTSAHEMERDDA